MKASRILAAHYGQMPDAFDEWPHDAVTFEVNVLRALREDGEYPLTAGVFVDVLKAALGGK